MTMQAKLAQIQERAESERKRFRNTINSIKLLLTANEPQKAFLLALEAYGRHNLPQELRELFRQYSPAELCPDLAAEASNKMEGALIQRGVGPLFKNATLGDFPPSLTAQIPDNQGAYIYGPCGAGKTHLLSACFRRIAERNAIRVNSHGEYELTPIAEYPLMVSIPEVLLDVRRTFKTQSRSDESQIIDAVTSPSFLFLDDIGTEKSTEWALQIIYLILDRRYKGLRQTYFSSNLSLGELSERLGDRIASRIAGMCRVIQLNGKDRRIR